MKKPLLSLALVAASCLVSFESEAQRFKNSYRYTSVGLNLNSMQYFGDIVPRSHMASFDIRFNRPQFGAFVMRRINPQLSYRASLSFGRLEGDDFTSTNPIVSGFDKDNLINLSSADYNVLGRYRRNLHFRNDIIELSAMAVWDLVGNPSTYNKRPTKLIPYVTGGVAGFYHNPRAKSPSGTWIALQPLQTEGVKYSKFQVAIPFGFGIRYRVSNKIDIGAEIAYRWTLTDYLDDVSGNYIDLGEFGDNDMPRLMHDRSRETSAVLKNQQRDIDYMPNRGVGYVIADGYYIPSPGTPGTYSYVGSDGRNYSVFGGYGHGGDHAGNRGNKSDNDQYLVVGFHLGYIIKGGIRCPKFQ